MPHHALSHPAARLSAGSSSSGEPHQAPQGTVKAAAHRSEDGVEDIQPDNSVVSAEPAPIKAGNYYRAIFSFGSL